MSKSNRTARHVACNVFRYPHRPPRLWLPASPYLLHPCSRARQATRRATPCQPEREVASMSAGERVGATPAIARVAEWLLLRARKAKTALLALRDLPPIPLKGALNRACNIMLEIMRSSQVALSLVPRSAQLVYCALRRIIYIMCKCPAATPLRSTAVRCAAHVRLCLTPLRAPAKAGFRLPALPCVSAWSAPASAKTALSSASPRPCHPSIMLAPWKKSSCTCGQRSTVLEPSRPSPSGSPLRSEALTALRAALVGWHVQKAFLGCNQPEETTP